MTPVEPRVLFVSHDSRRAGATIFLLNMLRWLAENSSLHFSVATREDGEMLELFGHLCTTYVLHPPRLIPRVKAWCRRIKGDKQKQAVRLQSLIDSGMFDVIYLNTITLGDFIKDVNLRGLPVITHVHEMPNAIRRYGRKLEQVVIKRSAQLICVSNAVAKPLVETFACPPEKIRQIYGFVPIDNMPSATRHELRRHLLSPLGVPSNALIVGFCGSAAIHKGIDLLLPLASQMPTEIKEQPIHFIWLGAGTAEYPITCVLTSATEAGLASRMHFPGLSNQPIDWMSLFDVHVSLSREDSFPLVVLEAASLGVPSVCFEGAGGASEFVKNDAGVTVPYLDLTAMARTLEVLLMDEIQRAQLGQVARMRVRSNHSPAVTLPEIYKCIESVCEQKLAQHEHSTAMGSN